MTKALGENDLRGLKKSGFDSVKGKLKGKQQGRGHEKTLYPLKIQDFFLAPGEGFELSQMRKYVLNTRKMAVICALSVSRS